MNWLYRLERKFGKFSIPNLMLIIVVGQFAVFAADLIMPALNASGWLYLSRSLVMSGQIWRLITFIFIPPSSSVLMILISLYFYYMIGGALENEWGSFKFNVYYLVGMIGIIIASFLTGAGSNYYLNMSLFFAFAILWPDFEVMLFFIIPIKMKYLALFDAILFIINIASSLMARDWATFASIIASLLNVILFFGGDLMHRIKREQGYAQTRKNWRSQMNEWDRNGRNFK
ncbi:MAG: rhomboid family intramembrane serine protease [Oscillospiraceae bacterium]